MLDTIATSSPRIATAAAAAGPSKYGSLTARQATRPNRRSLQTTTTTGATTKAHEFESIELHDVKHITPIMQTQRSVSCFELGSDARRYRTIRIGEGSDELRQLSQANVTQLLRTATSAADADSKNALLARKALRYRKIWTPEAEECTPVSVSC